MKYIQGSVKSKILFETVSAQGRNKSNYFGKVIINFKHSKFHSLSAAVALSNVYNITIRLLDTLKKIRRNSKKEIDSDHSNIKTTILTA